jgi:hypothetical protein
MIVRVAAFSLGLLLGLFCNPAIERSQAAQPGSCAETDAPRGAGLRSFCRRAERLASLPIGFQFVE